MPDEGVHRHEHVTPEPAMWVRAVTSLVLHPERHVDILEQAPTVPLNEIPTRLAVNTPYSYGAQVHAKPPLVTCYRLYLPSSEPITCLA